MSLSRNVLAREDSQLLRRHRGSLLLFCFRFFVFFLEWDTAIFGYRRRTPCVAYLEQCETCSKTNIIAMVLSLNMNAGPSRALFQQTETLCHYTQWNDE